MTGITLGGYRRYQDDQYRKLREHGYDCCDFCMADTEDALYSGTEAEFAARLAKERAAAEIAGIRIHQVHGPWRWPFQDATEADRAERMEKMKKSIRGTALLGCRYWVIHPIMPYGIHDAGTELADQTWEMNFAFMCELLKTAKEVDVVICLENLPFTQFSLASAEAVKRFVAQMNDENFKACLDTGHAAVFPGADVAGAIRLLGEDIRVLHVHDNDGLDDRHFMPYFGVIDWASVKQALQDISFTGVLSLESSLPRTLPEAQVENAQRLLAGIAKQLAE